MADVLRLFIVRYKRESAKSYPKGIWDTMERDDVALASQLVARDNGSDESL